MLERRQASWSKKQGSRFQSTLLVWNGGLQEAARQGLGALTADSPAHPPRTPSSAAILRGSP